MMIQHINNDKPSIKIYYYNKLNKYDFKDLLYGIEEEGIPYVLISHEINCAIDLGYESCMNSKLGVGIGISNKDIVLHFEKLDKLTPLFKINIDSKKSTMRSLGSNAARLVKRMPFKEM